MTIGFHTLAVHDGRCGLTALALVFEDECAEGVVERRPLMVEGPLPEDMVDGFPRRKVSGQIMPWVATFDLIEYGIHDASPVCGRAAALGWFGEHRLEEVPLGIGEVGVMYSVFHAPTEAALENETLCPKRNVDSSLHLVECALTLTGHIVYSPSKDAQGSRCEPIRSYVSHENLSYKVSPSARADRRTMFIAGGTTLGADPHHVAQFRWCNGRRQPDHRPAPDWQHPVWHHRSRRSVWDPFSYQHGWPDVFKYLHLSG